METKADAGTGQGMELTPPPDQVAEKKEKGIVAVGITPQGGLLPTDMDGLWRLASIMGKSGFMPKGIETTEAVFVAVQMGLEVGLSPMQAVQNISVINGRPAIWGDAQLGLVQASGLLEDFDEKYTGEYPKDDFTAICVCRRKGRRGAIKSEFSISDARSAGLWMKQGKQGQETPWVTYPKRMLKMRARGFALRDGFADVLKGLKSVEEARDIPFEGVEMERGADGKFQTAERAEDQRGIEADKFWQAAEAKGIKRDEPDMVKHLAKTAEFFKIDTPAVIAQLIERDSDMEVFLDGFLKQQNGSAQAPPLKPGQRRSHRGPAPQVESEGRGEDERQVICPNTKEPTFVKFCNSGSCKDRATCPELVV